MSEEINEEFEAVSRMLKAAFKENMLVEVVWSFANGMRSGHREIPEAAEEALYEWDI